MEGDERNNQSIDERIERRTEESVEGNNSRSFTEQIEALYKEGLKLNLLYKDMYEMDLDELTNTIVEKRKGMAYTIWRTASLVRHPLIKDFPETPEKAMPELFPPKPTIPMPDFLKEKYIKRKGAKI